MENPEQKHRTVINQIVVKTLASEEVNIISSRALPDDEFAEYYKNGEVIEPIYAPECLIKLPEKSDILQQCIDAYKTNITGFGTTVEYDIDYDKLTEAEKKDLDVQWNKLSRFLQFCNFDESFIEIMEKVIDDRERIGYGCLEVISDAAGMPANLHHVAAHKVRLCCKEEKTTIRRTIIDENDKEVEIITEKQFRRFVQIVGTKRVYFKEFGDPRILNCETGEYDENTPPEKQATSMIFFNIHCSYTDYGLPRYIGQLLNAIGNRKAEELNYKYFEDGRHVPLAIVVEGGKLTDKSMDDLTNAKGNIASHKFLVIEAEGLAKGVALSDDEEISTPKVRFEKLVEIMEKDGLFQEYCSNNRNKIRSAYRLPPIYVGESQDYTRATAETARDIAEEQVFQPERTKLQFKLNNLLKPALGIGDVSLHFNSPKSNNDVEIAGALSTYINGGVASPNMLIDALGKLLGKSLEPYDEPWADKPIILYQKELEAASQMMNMPGGSVLMPEDEVISMQKSDKSQVVADILDGLKSLREAIEEATENVK